MAFLAATGSTSKDPLTYIDAFFNDICASFTTHVLDIASSFWGSYYAICFVPLFIWFAYVSLRYTAGAYSGDKLKQELQRAGWLIGFMIIGFLLIPGVEHIGSYIGKEVDKGISVFGAKINNSVSDASNVGALDFSADTEENRILWNAVSKSEMQSYNIMYSIHNESELSHRILSNEDVKTIEVIKQESGVESINTPEAKIFEKQPSVEELSFWDFNFIDWITYCLLLIGNVLKGVMLLFRLFLIALFRFSFPIALALSFIPTLEKTIFTWLESYFTVVMMGVTITLISSIATFTSCLTISSDSYNASFMGAIMAFVCGIFYLLSPAITVMLFGGSQVVSQLPQQGIMAGAAMISLASKLVKSTKAPQEPKENLQEPGNAGGDSINPNTL